MSLPHMRRINIIQGLVSEQGGAPRTTTTRDGGADNPIPKVENFVMAELRTAYNACATDTMGHFLRERCTKTTWQPKEP